MNDKLYIIYFTGESPDLIKMGHKTMTARFWLRKPPRVGQLVRAQTGRPRTTQFAILEITKVFRWNGVREKTLFYDFYDAKAELAPSRDHKLKIAVKEGFASWDVFYDTYHALNAHHFDDEKRTHYFIEFERKVNL